MNFDGKNRRLLDAINPFGVTLRQPFSLQLKQDVCNAINLLILKNVFSLDTFCYAFVVDQSGRERVMTWDCWPEGSGMSGYKRQPTYDDPREFIVAAGKLSLVRGKTDSL